MMGLRKSILLLMVLICTSIVQEAAAQKKRFSGLYPLAAPKSESEKKPEFETTMTAMIGGIRIMQMGNTPTKREDEETFVIDDYKRILSTMQTYAAGLADELGTDGGNKLTKVAKSVNSGKYENAIADLKALGGESSEEAESLFFIWKEYLGDIKAKAPWTDPKNIRVTSVYRSMLNYVSKNYDRPFGAQAEQGAILADAAQALSNCLEDPDDIAWKGGAKMNMRTEDELRRLASNVSYYNWRLHDRISGKRSAHIDPAVVRNLQLSLYDIVRTTLEKKEHWDKDPAHGANLKRLVDDTKKSGWMVNGNKAQKRS